jgi:cytochrome c oxidase subunit 2
VRELTYTQPQILIAILFVVITVLLVGVFVTVARSSRREVPFDEVKTVGYGIRRWWLAGLATLLGAGVVASLFLLPYSGARGATGKAQLVSVKGGQYYWAISPKTVSTGHVKFTVTSADVNHGLGIYSPKGEMLGNVQAMPGYTNRLDIQLDEPGEYLFSCLELCGVSHHKMHATLTVTSK